VLVETGLEDVDWVVAWEVEVEDELVVASTWLVWLCPEVVTGCEVPCVDEDGLEVDEDEGWLQVVSG